MKIAAAAKILEWIQNKMEVFDVASEFIQKEKCREHFICELYHRNYMEDSWVLNKLHNLLENFPIFHNAKMSSNDSMSRREGCQYHYNGCTAISRTFHGNYL